MTVSDFSPDQSSESCAKFKDQAHRIYTDSLRKKHPNGGLYPLSGMSGLALANGHGPPHGQPRLNVDANPLSDMDHMHHRSHSPPNHRDLYSGKPYPHVSCFSLSLSLVLGILCCPRTDEDFKDNIHSNKFHMEIKQNKN